MREILFRGKRVDNGEWETGSLIVIRAGMADEQVYIADKMTGYHTPVIPETVGQYTGLKDKDGKRIFEWDIVRLHYFYEAIDGETLGVYEAENEHTACIKIDKYGVWFQAIGVKLDGYLCDYIEEPEEELDVIGNIHDNPELLEVE